MAPSAPALLHLEHITMRFGGLTALNDVSLQAQSREITAIIGPNGAGKTTLFNCITGFYKPTSGRMTLTHADGKSYALERMQDYTISRRARVARTFQNIRLFTGLTLLENLLIAQHRKLSPASGFGVLGLIGWPKYAKVEKEATEKARYWLEKTGLLSRADEAAGSLSYGDQRRLEIARAMCTDPVLLCLDEPAAGLNPRESLLLNTLLFSLRDEHATSLLLIEHDMSVVMEISDHVVVLDYGQKIAEGPPRHIKEDPRVIAAYLGVEEASEVIL